MDLNDIEQLVKLIREANISALTVSSKGVTVKLKKPLLPAGSKSARPAARKAAHPAVEAAASKPAPEEIFITAPMVGIFHSIESVSAPGTVVKAGQVVGVIESMKLMNDVICERDGIVADVLIEDDMPVEFGQDLFRLENE